MTLETTAMNAGNIAAVSLITCPRCGHAQSEVMPTDACLWFYECARCHALLRPEKGDCCVFCSYGSVPCPPVQAGRTPRGCCPDHS